MDRRKLTGLGLGLMLAASGTIGAAVGWSSHPTGTLSQPVFVGGGYGEFFYNFARQGSSYVYVDAYRSMSAAGYASVTRDRIGASQDVRPVSEWNVFMFMRVCANGCESFWAYTGRSGFNYEVDYDPIMHTYSVTGTYRNVPFQVHLIAEGNQRLAGYSEHGIDPIGTRQTPLRGYAYASEGTIRDTAFQYARYGHRGMGGDVNYDYGYHFRGVFGEAAAGYNYYGGCGAFVEQPLVVAPKGC